MGWRLSDVTTTRTSHCEQRIKTSGWCGHQLHLEHSHSLFLASGTAVATAREADCAERKSEGIAHTIASFCGRADRRRTRHRNPQLSCDGRSTEAKLRHEAHANR